MISKVIQIQEAFLKKHWGCSNCSKTSTHSSIRYKISFTKKCHPGKYVTLALIVVFSVFFQKGNEMGSRKLATTRVYFVGLPCPNEISFPKKGKQIKSGNLLLLTCSISKYFSCWERDNLENMFMLRFICKARKFSKLSSLPTWLYPF